MSGQRQRPATRRLWTYLWVWAFSSLLFVWLVLAAFSYLTGLHEADEISDGLLASVARVMLDQPTFDAAALAAPLSAAKPRLAKDAYAPELRAIVWQDRRLVWDSHPALAAISPDTAPGYRTVRLPVSGQDHSWRLLVAEAQAGGVPGRRVAVLVSRDRRVALARDMAEHIVRPSLVLLPLLAVLLAWAIRQGLLPFRQLSDDIATLDVAHGQQLRPGQSFEELEVAVGAINDLVRRLAEQVERERQFASDVAHELRTPVTALMWQARAAMDVEDAAERKAVLERVQQEAVRAGHILTQLLELARSQRLDGEAQDWQDLVPIAQQVVADHVPLAHERGQDIAMEVSGAPVRVRGHPTMLALALRNLVDNALRHNPRGTQVELRLTALSDGAVTASVSDSGPLHPPAPANSAGEGLAGDADSAGHQPAAGADQGLGIGLSLVQRLAGALGARLHRDEGDPPYTRRYVLHWPPASAQPERAAGR